MEFSNVDEYLKKLFTAGSYKKLPDPEKEQLVFQAIDTLSIHYSKRRLTTRAVGLQALFMLEGEQEDYSQLRRQNVKAFSTKGISVQLDSLTAIAPEVRELLGTPRSMRARVGRMI